MSEEEFFSRLLNKIDKEFGYDVASTLELMFMTREKKIEQLENIRKKAIEFTNSHFKEMVADEEAQELLNILNKGDSNGK